MRMWYYSCMKIVVVILLGIVAFWALAFSWKFIIGLAAGAWIGYEMKSTEEE